MTLDHLPDFFTAERMYTTWQRRVEALRAHPDVQAILAKAVTADAATLRSLHHRWLAHFRDTRTAHTRLWHAFVKARGDGWRDVFALGEDAWKLMERHDAHQWGASHAVADAVKAVHMAAYVDPAELATVYTTPWITVFEESK